MVIYSNFVCRFGVSFPLTLTVNCVIDYTEPVRSPPDAGPSSNCDVAMRYLIVFDERKTHAAVCTNILMLMLNITILNKKL